MNAIEIDDEVFDFLEKSARPFLEVTPNLVLRRLLGLPAASPSPDLPISSGSNVRATPFIVDSTAHLRRKKAPKANLKEIVRAGLIQDGQTLQLVDYQGNRIDQYEAVVAGGMLKFNGEHFTMSNLAKELLKQVGYESDNVRGPAHWANAEGVTIKEIWETILRSRREASEKLLEMF